MFESRQVGHLLFGNKVHEGQTLRTISIEKIFGVLAGISQAGHQTIRMVSGYALASDYGVRPSHKPNYAFKLRTSKSEGHSELVNHLMELKNRQLPSSFKVTLSKIQYMHLICAKCAGTQTVCNLRTRTSSPNVTRPFKKYLTSNKTGLIGYWQ